MGLMFLSLNRCILLLTYPTSYTIFIVASAFFGMGFGGNLSTLAAIVALHFPGGSLAFPFNFGLTMLAPAFGNIFVGTTEAVLDDSSCKNGNVSVSLFSRTI